MSNSSGKRIIRRVILGSILVFCLMAVITAIWTICVLFANPFAGFDGQIEFENVSGAEAKTRLDHGWPPSVDPDLVQQVSYKTAWTIDSHSTWIRIKLSKAAAENWLAFIEGEIKRSESEPHLYDGESIEGIHRAIVGPPSLRCQTGETPAWWNPPAIEYRATEVMKWYKECWSGVGLAIYRAFDESAGELWIYDYSAQHDALWSPGRMPSGPSTTHFRSSGSEKKQLNPSQENFNR